MITVDYVLAIASNSECSRRKYGAVITDLQGEMLSYGYNERVGICCNNTCARDRLQLKHGENTDAGAEIHAEQALLINMNFGYTPTSQNIFVAGSGPEGRPLNGFENSPCYSCARMIKYANFTHVYLPFDSEWEPVSINDIMENWEQSWERNANLPT